ncbi:MAG: cache domain-containing protein, partial [Firmicutes bacterium]|nr:cache domain-containing protein [Bacillota bacterium]
MKVTGEKKQFLRSSSDIRRGWLLSYMVIFCLPLIAYLLMSFITLGIIRRQTYDLNERALDVTAVAMDHQVQSIDAVATELVANTILGELLAREIEGSEKEYKLYELKKELASMVSQNAMIEQIYIYMYDGDYIISDTTKASLSIFFENECSELLMSGQEWRNILRTPHLREYATWESEWARPTTMMLVSVPLFEGAPKATICIKMSSAKFWRVLEQNQSMEMSVYDNQKKSLYSQKHEAQTDPVVLKSQDTGWVYEAYIE